MPHRTLTTNTHVDHPGLREVPREKSDKLNPAPAYIESKLEQVKSGKLCPETLSEVLSREDHAKPPPRFTVSASGDIRFRSGEAKGGTMTTKREESRKTFKLMGAC